ncbi:MAG: hypothetical protein IKP96_01650, partial [Elusimicrobiaceae bacterium]|nr:hypothetical protein [Elusimicrobiaceae bacterium]
AYPLEEKEKIVLQGNGVTDGQGSFTVSFTPTRQEEDEEFANYILEAQVYDESGRPITASRTYQVSAHPNLFQVDFLQGFYDANKTASLAEINLTDAEGNAVTGSITLSVSQLENRQPSVQTMPLRCYDCPSPSTHLDTLYKDFAVEKTAFTRTLNFQKPGSQTIQLPALPEGVYRLELSSPKAATQKMIFIVAKEKSALQLPNIALVQQKTYYPGENLRVLLGAGDMKGTKFVEMYQGEHFLTYRTQLPGGVQIFSFPLNQDHRGGVALRWFGADDYLFHQAQAVANVPFDNKQLQINTTIPDTVKPGQKINWKISVKDATGSPVNGLVNATVYDKSLDYYVSNRPFLTFSKLYFQNATVQRGIASNQRPSTIWYQVSRPHLNGKNLPFLPLPTLNLEMGYRRYGVATKGIAYANVGSKRSYAAKGAALNDAADEMQSLQMNMKEAAPMLAKEEFATNLATQISHTEEETIPVRTDFSETAYFNPSIPLTGGQAALQFTLPQTLTTWNLFGFALTSNVLFGGFEGSFISQKDLMLRLQMPRFYREHDHGVIQAAITNQTRKKITTAVTLSIKKDSAYALDAFGVKQPVQSVTLPPQSTQFVTWDITAPADPALYQVTAVARTASANDGEQKTLPVLPGKMRLLASTHAALKNGDNQLVLSELAGVPAQDIEITALTLNPSLALSVINKMPNLLSSPYKDLVSSLNRYVPLAVVNQFYTAYPQLKEAVKKLPKRTGITPSWNETDPLRLQLLEQTPWLRQAQGRQVRQADLINLFDDKIVSSALEREMKNITKFQNKNGAFSWFAGGPDDVYLTLYALRSFGEALSYQAQIPQQSAKKAFAYVLPKIEEQLRRDSKGSVQAVSYALYAAYTLSSFPGEWKEVSQAKPYIKRWIEYADKYAKFMTPLGQVYAAVIYHRLGDDVKANSYLDRVLSRLKQDPLTGAYFAPEAQSWLWYNDTLTTQTVTLRALLEMRPQSDKIDALTQWLLFNRQVNDWTDSKAASQAVFTLLDIMKTKGALSTPSSYKIQWGGQTRALTFEPLDWTEDLQFVRTDSPADKSTANARITKQGPQTDFASLSAVYQTANADASPKGVINVERNYFLRQKQGQTTKLLPIDDLTKVRVGDEIEVHLTLNTDSAFEYVLLQDPKPAGFESEALLSGWDYQNLSFYREVKDAATHFFINWVPRGTVTLHYILRPTVAGQLHALPAQAQSMYAPQYGAHSASSSFHIEK